MFRSYRTLACLILACLLAGALLGLHRERVARGEAEERARTAQVALAQVQATLAHRERLRRSTARREALAGHALSAAIASTPKAQEWASQPVPEEIQDALRAHLPGAAASRSVSDSGSESLP